MYVLQILGGNLSSGEEINIITPPVFILETGGVFNKFAWNNVYKNEKKIVSSFDSVKFFSQI